MGLMDKVKEGAAQLAEKSKQGVAQGQAKLDTMQAKKQIESLFRDLGAATYAAERKGGPPRDEVERLLAAIDAHETENGPVDTSTSPAADTATSTTSSTEGGDFRLDED